MVGCLGNLGQKVAAWMAERGAKHLTFISRTGDDSPSAAAAIRRMDDLGVKTLVLRADVTDKQQLQRAIGEARAARPNIRGVVHAAAALRDAMFSNMTIDNWRTVVDIKVKGAQNLHEVLQDEPLDFFVMTSSITATLGTAGQTNYAAGKKNKNQPKQNKKKKKS